NGRSRGHGRSGGCPRKGHWPLDHGRYAVDQGRASVAALRRQKPEGLAQRATLRDVRAFHPVAHRRAGRTSQGHVPRRPARDHPAENGEPAPSRDQDRPTLEVPDRVEPTAAERWWPLPAGTSRRAEAGSESRQSVNGRPFSAPRYSRTAPRTRMKTDRPVIRLWEMGDCAPSQQGESGPWSYYYVR